MNPLVIIFYHMANDYQGSILGKKTAQNLHLDNQPPCDFHYGVHATNSHNWGKLSIYPRRDEIRFGNKKLTQQRQNSFEKYKIFTEALAKINFEKSQGISHE